MLSTNPNSVLIVPVEKARRLLGRNALGMTDEKIVALIHELDRLATIIIESYKVQRNNEPKEPVMI